MFEPISKLELLYGGHAFCELRTDGNVTMHPADKSGTSSRYMNACDDETCMHLVRLHCCLRHHTGNDVDNPKARAQVFRPGGG